MNSLHRKLAIGSSILFAFLLAIAILVIYQALLPGQTDAGLTSLRRLLWTVYVMAVALAGIAAWLLVKMVVRPFSQLQKNIQDNMNGGNVGARLVQTGQNAAADALAGSYNQLMDRLEHASGLQKDFVHYASHEIRTPITALISITENALNRKLSTDQYEEVLQQLFEQQKNLAGITNSLLLLTDKKPVDHSYAKVRLDELVFRAVEFVQHLFPDAVIEVSLEVKSAEEDTLMIRANEPLLLMAFNNLLKNAIQYSDDQVAIVILRMKERTREIVFKNTGDVFSDSEQSRIYEPFYRASNAKNKKGLGLGLAIVKQIAEIHSAEIKYQHEGGYNVFSFCFTEEPEENCEDAS